MKKHILWGACFGILLLALLLCGSDALTALALPFVLVGKGLRMLSLAGAGGNVAAIVLYVLLSLLPLLLLIGKRIGKEDLLLPVTSALLFYVQYVMVNPGLRPAVLLGSVGDVALCGSVYSLLLTWVVLRFLRKSHTLEASRLYGTLQGLVLLCIGLFTASIAGAFTHTQSMVSAVKQANTMPGLQLTPTFVFLYTGFAVKALEYVLDCLVLFSGLHVLQAMAKDTYSEETCQAAEVLSRRCRAALTWVLFSTAALNVSQIVFAARLHHLSSSIQIPLLSIALLTALLLLVRLLSQGKQLKDDNDLFI